MVALALASLIPLVCGTYVVLLYLTSLRRKKSADTVSRKPKNRIAVVIPAHNEERVIAQAVQSALRSDYPRELFDVIVIADNCGDRTAKFAREAGAIVHERVDPHIKNKAAALKWLFYSEGLLSMGYDGLCILDADTTVERDFLPKLESRLQEGHTIIQGRGLTSNMGESPVAYAMGLIESSQNRFWHYPMQRHGLCDLYLGKGVLIAMPLLDKLGWHIHTLVEDLEFSLQAMIAGETIYFCNDAVFYSEQAPSYGLFWRQQRRWTSGHIHCSQMYIGNLHREFTKNSRPEALPLLIYCLMPYSMAIGFINIFLSPLLTAAATHLYAVSIIASIISLIVQYMGVAMFGGLLTRLDGRSITKNLRGIFTMPLLTMSLGLLNLVSFLRPKRSWEAMQHATRLRPRDIR